jgi:hypothetical protein
VSGVRTGTGKGEVCPGVVGAVVEVVLKGSRNVFGKERERSPAPMGSGRSVGTTSGRPRSSRSRASTAVFLLSGKLDAKPASPPAST